MSVISNSIRGLRARLATARGNPLFLAGMVLAVVIILADQASKFWILKVFDLPAKGSVEVLPFFSLSMVWNEGVSFGFLAGSGARHVLIVFSIVVAILLSLWLAEARRRMFAFGLGAVIGGALGNVIDRVRYGAVADFLDFSGLYFPWVFNVADSAITVGAGLILLDSVIGSRERPPRAG
ncbi:MAG: signal peptidase II [Parvularculaceae bacterium]